MRIWQALSLSLLPLWLGSGLLYADQCPAPILVATWMATHQTEDGWILHDPEGVKTVTAFDHVEWNSHGGGNVPPDVIGCVYTRAAGQMPWVFVDKTYASSSPPSGVNWSPLVSYFGCVATNALDPSTCAWT